ncbi:MAG TPA: hypothetical protein VFC92_08850 [Bacteroidales bacterium]|nr:hypothetical protein [Bacteroidales bacterium]
MKTLLIDIEGADNLQAFLQVVKKLNFVKSVKLVNPDKQEPNASSANEPQKEYFWTNPSRPASENEIDLLIDTMEGSEGEYSTDEVRQNMKQWAAEKSK